jgi:hypothetical protein
VNAGSFPSQAFGHAKKPLPEQILVFLKAAGANDGRALPVTVYFTGKTAAQSGQVLPDHRVSV